MNEMLRDGGKLEIAALGQDSSVFFFFFLLKYKNHNQDFFDILFCYL